MFNAQNEIACVVTTVSFVKTAEATGHWHALRAMAAQASLESGASRGSV